MRALLPALLLLTGCPSRDEADAPYCQETPTDVALDEVTPLGFSAADVLARLPAHQDDTLTWATGETTALSLDFAPADTARYVDSEAVYPDDGGATIDIGVVCDAYVAVDVDFGFATADGRFDESLATEVYATAESLGAIQADLDLDNLVGTFSIDDFTDVTDYDEARARIAVALQEDAVTTGSIDGDVSGEDECTGDTCTAWDQAVPVGTWGAAVE